MLILFWDIDGTLLTTNRAGILAWEGATQPFLGQSPDFSTLETAGLTDIEIAGRILTRFGLPAGLEQVTALVHRYEALLPLRLPERAGQVLPGVREVLDHLRDCPDVRSFLLTGNTAAGGRAKLRHYGLDGYFDHGAFADGAPDRVAIAHRALGLARELVGRELSLTWTYVIGDTPHDIRCAREIGARSVAVASGTYSVADLRRHEPWCVLERLPDPVAFLDRLRTDAADGAPRRDSPGR